MYQLFLVMGGASTLILSSLHIGILFIWPSAYEFLEAPQLAEMAANGAILPTFISLFFVFLFLLFSWYAFSSAGFGIKLPARFFVLSVIGWLFIVRGIAVFIYLYFYFTGSVYTTPKEIRFRMNFLNNFENLRLL